ncbi:histidine kinase [Psychrobacter sp. NPDC078761]|uniref:histidine kinase n=2 Tax=unclassified Psychrobacter TaxID=196806 RepID=UPI000ADBE677
MEIMRPWQWLTYIFFWSLFLTVIERHGLSGWSDFIIKFFSRVIQNALTVIPALYLVDYLRPVFKNASIPSVSLRIVMLMMFSATVSMVLVVLVMINLGWMEYNRQAFVINLMFNTVLTGGFTAVFLLYFLRSHRELNALKLSFEYKLTAQNDLIKARTAPHFFFNTINTLVSLIESNPPKAADLLQHVSALFRASFSGTREISFEEEVDLCEHYLAIESSRLADKLEVNWTLPEEDIMYDMVITALTLQSVLEKILLNVVEMTTETICINIEVTWEQHRVKIMIDVALPKKTLIINHDLRQHMNFYIQADRLRAHFGQSADIQSSVASTQIITIIDYPLQDVGL